MTFVRIVIALLAFFAHDLFRKPPHTLRDHALIAAGGSGSGERQRQCFGLERLL
jgi:hypothetical protein